MAAAVLVHLLDPYCAVPRPVDWLYLRTEDAHRLLPGVAGVVP
jgi:hypothetical protein